MRRRLALFGLGSVFPAALVLAVACGSDPPANKLPVTDAPDSGGPTNDPPDRLGDGGGLAVDGADPVLPDGGKPPGRVYAHTPSTLYRYDPLANTLTRVGDFSCVPHTSDAVIDPENDSVIDIALDRTGQMFATTFWRFIRVDATSGACTVVKLQTGIGAYPNSLSFVPLGTVDPTRETLVGYGYDLNGDARTYTRIDLDTGELTEIGDINPTPLVGGVTYGLAGDFISLGRDQARTYGAVKDVGPDAGAEVDALAELDPKTGKIKRIIGSIGTTGLFGMGFWAGKAYGFSSNGTIYEIDPLTGNSKIALVPPADAGVITWYGAGVTTDSPTAP